MPIRPSLDTVADLAVNDGDITSTATTFNLLNSVVNTVNAFGAATTISIGATTGTLTLNNPSVRFADGTAAAPSIAQSSTPATGLAFLVAGQISVVAGNNERIRMGSAGLNIGQEALQWGVGFNADTILVRDAANTLALRNGVNAQKFNWYATYTDASNYEGGYLTAAAGSVTLGARTLGTGTDNIDIALVPAGTGNVKFGTYTSLGAETLQGYIIMKDSGGTLRKLAVIA